MSEEFERYMKGWTDEDHREFEKLCFFRAEEIAEPYTALMRAHEIEERAAAEEIVKRAYEASKDKIARANDDVNAGVFERGAQVFADAIGEACAGPGRGPALTDTTDAINLGHGEAHYMREKGFVMERFYGGFSGLIWDSFWFRRCVWRTHFRELDNICPDRVWRRVLQVALSRARRSTAQAGRRLARAEHARAEKVVPAGDEGLQENSMKLAYAGIFAAALLTSGAALAQTPTTIQGTAAYCMLENAVANCSYVDAQACQMELQRTAGQARKPACVARDELK